MQLRTVILAVICVVSLAAARVHAQIGNTFTYQGQLEVAGQPFTGNADFLFAIYPSAVAPSDLETIVVYNVPVHKGVFAAEVTFNTRHFVGQHRYLGVTVNAPSGGDNWVPLAGRQRLTAAPYAHYAVDAGNAQVSEFALNASRSATVDGISRNLSTNDIGIGLPNPGARLHVSSTSNVTSILESSSGIGAWLRLKNTSTGGRDWALISTGNNNGEGAGKLLFNDQTSGGNTRLAIDTNGRVGIGTNSPAERLEVAGNIRCDVLIVDGGSDVSESYDVAATGGQDALPGMVVSIDPEMIGKLRISAGEYDRTVAGIISGANGIEPGLVLNQRGTVADGRHPVANVGRVWCYVDADAGGPIVAGDLLTTSSTPGHAMKVSSHDRANGAVIGKAMSSLKEGKGLVLVLVGLQ